MHRRAQAATVPVLLQRTSATPCPRPRAAHPHWRVLGAPDDVLDALGATGFSFVRVRPEPDHPGVLAVKKLRCCEDGSPLYDRQAVLRSTP
ncbi:hypothetical protein HUT11_31240 [Streptomyces seoulensis]|nr:hypothetical protein HUT11_31240 [Streptomyces seoulensis]